MKGDGEGVCCDPVERGKCGVMYSPLSLEISGLDCLSTLKMSLEFAGDGVTAVVWSVFLDRAEREN